PDSRGAYRFRAGLLDRMDEHERAIADYDKLIELDPDQAELYDLRGSARFKLGRIEPSITDFDKAIELAPQREREHWKRGISYYYAGRYDEGRRQFEGYQTFDDNDVENAVWRYLCMAKSEGVERARRSLLKIKDDRRVPMMQVYALFAGQCEPDDVIEAARAGDPGAEELKGRLFYAHLYLGLYFDAGGDATRAREHIATAAGEHRIGHYMWHVARVHRMMHEGGREEGNQ
ncbi:MAG: tetratricopeptide repeat protein, partial [Pirellulales bacterium]